MSTRCPIKAAAILSGAKFYETGKPCKRGHICKQRTSSGACITCDSERQRRPDVISYKKDWFATRPGYRSAAFNKHYQSNAEAVLTRNEAYRIANIDVKRSAGRNYIARRRKADGKHNRDDVLWLLKAQKGKCAICFKKLGKDREVDHIMPLSKGGANDRSNLQVTHRQCNRDKAANNPIIYAQKVLGRLL